jgi:hypothetical protein
MILNEIKRTAQTQTSKRRGSNLVLSLLYGRARAAFLHSEDDARQPEAYRVAVAAKWLGGAAWELNNLEEPDRTYWINRGLCYHNAEIEASNLNAEMNSEKG